MLPFCCKFFQILDFKGVFLMKVSIFCNIIKKYIFLVIY